MRFLGKYGLSAMTLDDFFTGQEESRIIFESLHKTINALGPVELRITKSQVAFRRRRAFAWAWMPDQYLRGKHAPLVLSVSFRRKDPSPRWKEIVEPVPNRFTHHLELYSAADVDDEIGRWLQEAWIAAVIVNVYLLVMMMTLSPRVWGYSDYSAAIKAKVPPQTKREKRLGLIVGLPWMIFTLGFPIFSTYALKSKLGGELSFWTAFLNLFVLVFLATIGDLVILDWLIVNTITPEFVTIPGTEKADYKDFSHHYKAHARSAVLLVLLCIILAIVVWYF